MIQLGTMKSRKENVERKQAKKKVKIFILGK